MNELGLDKQVPNIPPQASQRREFTHAGADALHANAEIVAMAAAAIDRHNGAHLCAIFQQKETL